jgi:hypothetical protein
MSVSFTCLSTDKRRYRNIDCHGFSSVRSERDFVQLILSSALFNTRSAAAVQSQCGDAVYAIDLSIFNDDRRYYFYPVQIRIPHIYNFLCISQVCNLT